MRLTTLCYIRRNGCWLMMNRNRKKQDENAGKWIGIGGHLEADESPDECICREVLEETGLTLLNPRMRGILTFILPDWGNEMTFLYTAEAAGELAADCSEGTLAWIPLEDVMRLPLWEGDRIFLPMLQADRAFFSLKLIYAPGGRLTGCALDGRDITKDVLGEIE